jgi:hypothetical protein
MRRLRSNTCRERRKLLSLGDGTQMFTKVIKLARLCLIIPVSNATVEQYGIICPRVTGKEGWGEGNEGRKGRRKDRKRGEGEERDGREDRGRKTGRKGNDERKKRRGREESLIPLSNAFRGPVNYREHGVAAGVTNNQNVSSSQSINAMNCCRNCAGVGRCCWSDILRSECWMRWTVDLL